MPIDEVDKIVDPIDVPMLQKVLGNIHNNAVGIIYTSTEPTTDTTPTGKLVVYDNGAGTKRIYFKTGLVNLGYITLT